MPVVIPFDNTFSNFSEEVTLEDVSYIFNFTYNGRSEQWSMSIHDIDDNHIVDGIALIMNFNLFDQYRTADLPPGEMYIVDTTGLEEKVTRENMGSILELVYIPEDEVDSI